MCSEVDIIQGGPIAKRAIVVTPSSLMNNWKDEFRKWLGEERLQALVLQSGPDAAQQVRFLTLNPTCQGLHKHCISAASVSADLISTDPVFQRLLPCPATRAAAKFCSGDKCID